MWSVARTEMDDTSLGGVVCTLQLRDVDNVSTHTGSSNEATVGVVLQLLAGHGGHLLLLTSPMGTCSTSTVEGAVKIRCDYLAVMVNLPVEHGTLCPRDPGIGDEDVETAVEFLDDLINHLLNVLGVRHVDLISLAYE